MQSTIDQSANDQPWKNLAPFLEEAMSRLGEVERNAILLRFFENKSMNEVASSLNMNEAAVKKRVARALEKLRMIFVKRGITVSASVLACALGTHSIQAAPAGFATMVTSSSIGGAATTASASTLATETTQLLMWMKLKAALVMGAAALLAITTTVSVVEEIQEERRGGLGLFLGTRDSTTGKFIVQGTYANSPAREAGFPTGVILNKFDGVPVEQMKVIPVRGPVGSTVRLEIVNPRTRATSEVELVRKQF